MARSRKRTRRRETPTAAAGGEQIGGSIDHLIRAALMYGTTGRSIIVLEDVPAGVASLRNFAGLRTVSTADFTDGVVPPQAITEEAILLQHIGVVITPNVVDRSASLAMAEEKAGVRTIVPETLVWALPDGPGWATPPGFSATGSFPGGTPVASRSPEYWQGFLTALSQLVGSAPGSSGWGQTPPAGTTVPGFDPLSAGFGGQPIAGAAQFPGIGLPAPEQFDPSLAAAAAGAETWAMRITKVFSSSYSGKGVRVAILDTGLDLGHPDFQDGRVVARASFVGEPVQDVPTPRIPNVTNGNPGHGTHCTGLACGPLQPSGGSVEGRYGVAYGAQICVSKVLTNRGISVSGSVLQGMDWALQQKCHVISMSLGGPPSPFGDPYRQVAEKAVQAGAVIIAAVGNESNRPHSVSPVGSPANSLRIMGVGAIDENLRLGSFSNRGVYGTAAGVDVVAPGVRVYSSLPTQSYPGGKTTYGHLSGTSMATPIVAGIAALLMEARPNFGPLDILRTIVSMAQRLQGTDQNDTGAGLVQSP